MRFIALTLTAMIIAYMFLGALSFPLSLLTAAIPQQALILAGTQSDLAYVDGNHHIISGEWDAEINEACWGRLELAILFATIIASEDRALHKRLKGVLGGTLITLLLFNPIRITASLITLNEFVHDALFRASLLIMLVAYYALWYKKSKGVKQ